MCHPDPREVYIGTQGRDIRLEQELSAAFDLSSLRLDIPLAALDETFGCLTPMPSAWSFSRSMALRAHADGVAVKHLILGRMRYTLATASVASPSQQAIKREQSVRDPLRENPNLSDQSGTGRSSWDPRFLCQPAFGRTELGRQRLLPQSAGCHQVERA